MTVGRLPQGFEASGWAMVGMSICLNGTSGQDVFEEAWYKQADSRGEAVAHSSSYLAAGWRDFFARDSCLQTGTMAGHDLRDVPVHTKPAAASPATFFQLLLCYALRQRARLDHLPPTHRTRA